MREGVIHLKIVYIFHDYFSEFQCIDIKSEIEEIVLYISHMIKLINASQVINEEFFETLKYYFQNGL